MIYITVGAHSGGISALFSRFIASISVLIQDATLEKAQAGMSGFWSGLRGPATIR